jgi:hypothetical protein
MRQFIQILTIGLLTCLLACESNKVDETNIVEIENENEEIKFPIITDTIDIKPSKREVSWLTIARYKLLYIGDWRDTIIPDYRLQFYPYPLPPPPPGVNTYILDTIGYHKRHKEHRMFPFYDDGTVPINVKSNYQALISITVDTTQRVKNDISYGIMDSSYFEAYPVLIENKDTDTISIGFGGPLPLMLKLITEAKDSLGIWKPIEEERIYHHVNSSIILPPNKIGLSATMIYHGDYPTTMRLRIADTFSNEFKGTINYRQFESRYNEQGEYKEEYKQEMKE